MRNIIKMALAPALAASMINGCGSNELNLPKTNVEADNKPKIEIGAELSESGMAHNKVLKLVDIQMYNLGNDLFQKTSFLKLGNGTQKGEIVGIYAGGQAKLSERTSIYFSSAYPTAGGFNADMKTTYMAKIGDEIRLDNQTIRVEDVQLFLENRETIGAITLKPEKEIDGKLVQVGEIKRISVNETLQLGDESITVEKLIPGVGGQNLIQLNISEAMAVGEEISILQ